MSTTEFLTAVQNCINLAKKYSRETGSPGTGYCYVPYDNKLADQLPTMMKLVTENDCAADVQTSTITISHVNYYNFVTDKS